MAKPASLSIIVAIADNGVIGKEGGLPWRLGSDLRRFRKLTMGHPLIMGRKTFEAIGKPLDGRDSIVVTRSTVSVPQIFMAPSFDAAKALARECAACRRVDEIFIVGGVRIFKEALPDAQRIYLTRVHAAPQGDVHWEPNLDANWVEVSREERPQSGQDEFAVTDIILERRACA